MRARWRHALIVIKLAIINSNDETLANMSYHSFLENSRFHPSGLGIYLEHRQTRHAKFESKGKYNAPNSPKPILTLLC